MKRHTFIQVALVIMIAHGASAEYQPIRYERFLAQSASALDAQRKLIEQKLREMKAHREDAINQPQNRISRKKTPLVQGILSSSEITIQTLEARLTTIKSRLAAVAHDKSKLSTLKIADRTAEAALIRKATARENATDIQEQLSDISRMERLFEKLPAHELDPAALKELRGKWAAQRIALTTKLSRERA